MRVVESGVSPVRGMFGSVIHQPLWSHITYHVWPVDPMRRLCSGERGHLLLRKSDRVLVRGLTRQLHIIRPVCLHCQLLVLGIYT